MISASETRRDHAKIDSKDQWKVSAAPENLSMNPASERIASGYLDKIRQGSGHRFVEKRCFSLALRPRLRRRIKVRECCQKFKTSFRDAGSREKRDEMEC
jgi:hypothetical protein